MEEPNETTEAPYTPNPGAAIRKVIFTVGVLFVVWLLFGQVAPRLMFPKQTAHVETPPVAAVEMPAQPQADDHAATLAARVDTLEARLKVLEDVVTATPKPPADAPPPPPPPAAPPQAGMPAFVQEARIASLEKKLAEQEESLQSVQTEVAETQSKTGHQLALMTAFAQMKEASQRGESFTLALTQLQKSAEQNEAAAPLIEQLQPYAAKGVVTAATLKNNFEAIIPHALAHEEDTHSLMSNLRSLVHIRKVGQQQGNSDEAIIARAEASLNQDDIDGCLKEIGTLPPATADAFAAWTAEAQAYLTVHHTIDALQLALSNNNQSEADQTE